MTEENSNSHNGDSPLEGDVFRFTRRLSSITLSLRLVGLLSIVSLLSLAGTVFSMAIALIKRERFSSEGMFDLSTVAFVITILCLIIYDQLKRRGDTIFEELSDELQWHLAIADRSKTITSYPNPENRPEMSSACAYASIRNWYRFTSYAWEWWLAVLSRFKYVIVDCELQWLSFSATEILITGCFLDQPIELYRHLHERGCFVMARGGS